METQKNLILDFDKIEKEKEQIRLSLEKAWNLPDEWRSRDGQDKKSVIKKLEQALSALEEASSKTTESKLEKEEKIITRLNPKNSQSKEDNLLYSRRKNIFGQQEEARKKYFTPKNNLIKVNNEIYIPVSQPCAEKAQWQIKQNPVIISGGNKFSEIDFVKDETNGLSHKIKPGDKLNFSVNSKLKNSRLDFIDTIFEGRKEINAFNKIHKKFIDIQNLFDNLDPDDDKYDEKAWLLALQMDNFGNQDGLKDKIKKANAFVDDEDDFCDKATAIFLALNHLRNIDQNNSNDLIPPYNPSFKLSPYFQQKLGEMSNLINRQLGINSAKLKMLAEEGKSINSIEYQPKGFTIIVGPRGTGKNQLVDFYANETNRPLFRYSCSPDKEESDLTYDITLTNGEVVKIPSRILRAVTTENSILELDEINLLRPSIAKFFNALGDSDRSIYLNDHKINSAKGVLIIGLMNPAEYDGVEDLAETIDDRSNVMYMEYPEWKKIDPISGREKFTYDEALILKDNIVSLKNLSDSQFIKIWEYLINNIGTPCSPDDKIIQSINDIKKIIAIADRTREVVKSYKTRTGNLRMERDISIRGTIEAAKFYSDNQLWEKDVHQMPGSKPSWNAAKYSIAMTYLPHTETYRKGNKSDKDAINLILTEEIK